MTEVGRRLGVRYAVRGTVRRDGDRVRIMARLADTVRGSEIWGERYDRVLAALEIARARWGDTVAAAEQARTS